MSSAPEAATPLDGLCSQLQASVRLQVMAVFAHVRDVEFARPKEITGSSGSVMPKHQSPLSEAGLLKLLKATMDGRQRTWASMTRIGGRTFNEHVGAPRRVVDGSD